MDLSQFMMLILSECQMDHLCTTPGASAATSITPSPLQTSVLSICAQEHKLATSLHMCVCVCVRVCACVCVCVCAWSHGELVTAN